MEHIGTTLQKLNLPTANGLDSTLERSQTATAQTFGLPALLTTKLTTNEGISIAELTGATPLSDSDSATKGELLARLTAAYKLDYFNESSVHCMGAKDIFRRAVSKSWTAKEFLQRLDEMTETCAFPTWTPADFFRTERPKLYPYSWVLEECAKERSAMQRMEAYIIPPIAKAWYRYADGEMLEARYPEWFCVYRCGVSAYQAAKPQLRLAETTEKKEVSEVAKVWARVATAENDLEKLKDQITVLHKRIAQKDQIIAAKEEIIVSLESQQQQHEYSYDASDTNDSADNGDNKL